MRQVKKDFYEVPNGLKSKNADKKREELLREGNRHKFSQYFYRHHSALEKLIKIYNGKCAFCESAHITKASPWRIDHYRPKDKIKHEKDHTGYYWLAYEWSNLLLTCESCNRAKSNEFPVEGVRVESPPNNRNDWLADSKSLTKERPYLLNPEIDFPENHLSFYSDGRFNSERCSERGKETIRICHLNRKDLAIARKAKIDGFLKDITLQLEHIIKNQKKGFYKNKNSFHKALELGFGVIFNKLQQGMDDGQEYSLLGQSIYNEFEIFILSKLHNDEQRNIVRVAFILHKRHKNVA